MSIHLYHISIFFIQIYLYRFLYKYILIHFCFQTNTNFTLWSTHNGSTARYSPVHLLWYPRCCMHLWCRFLLEMLPGIKVGAVRLKYHVSRHLLQATTVYSKCVVYESIICGQWKYHTWRQLFQATVVICVACESGDTYWKPPLQYTTWPTMQPTAKL